MTVGASEQGQRHAISGAPQRAWQTAGRRAPQVFADCRDLGGSRPAR